MFGYVKKSEVIRIIENGQKQLRDKQDELIMMDKPVPETREFVFDFAESMNKLHGGIYFLERLKKHFR